MGLGSLLLFLRRWKRWLGVREGKSKWRRRLGSRWSWKKSFATQRLRRSRRGWEESLCRRLKILLKVTSVRTCNGGERAFEGNEPEASEVPVEPYAGAQLESEVRTFDPHAQIATAVEFAVVGLGAQA